MLLPSVISISVFALQILIKIIYYFSHQEQRNNNSIKQKCSNNQQKKNKESSNQNQEESGPIQQQGLGNNSSNTSFISMNDNNQSQIIFQQNESANNEKIQDQSEKEQQSILKQIWKCIINSDKNNNLDLFLTSFVFLQALVSRIYIKNTLLKIEFPQILYLSLINACVNVLFYNIFYGLHIKIFQMWQLDTSILKLILSLYHIGMPFFIYSGLDDYIQLDFITILFAIFYGSFLQIIIQSNLSFFPMLLMRIYFE